MNKLYWIAALGTGLLCAQTPDFSGVWKANPEKSKGIPPSGAYLAIIEQKDGRLTQMNGVTTQRGEQRSTYSWDLSGKEVRGTLGGLPMMSTAKWEGGALVVNGRQPKGAMTAKYTLSPDGNTLTLEIAGGREQTLVLEKQPASAGDALRKPEPTIAASGKHKNITVLGDAPDSSLINTMNSWAFALGKDCAFCHVQGNFAADDKPEKVTARKMVQMAMAINKNHFDGKQEVRCYTCHQGNAHPPGPKF